MIKNELRDPRNDHLRPKVQNVPDVPIIPPFTTAHTSQSLEPTIIEPYVAVQPPVVSAAKKESRGIAFGVFAAVIGIGIYLHVSDNKSNDQVREYTSAPVDDLASDLYPADTVLPSEVSTLQNSSNMNVTSSEQISSMAEENNDTDIAAPQVNVGDVWHMKTTDLRSKSGSYADVTFAVDQVNDEHIYITKTVTSRPDSATPLIYNSQMNLEQGKTGTYSPAMQYYEFPLHVGKEWSSTSTITGNTQKDHQKVDAKVAGWEIINTPLGEFNALRIDSNYTSYLNDVIVSQGADKSWYVPELKRAARTEEYSLNDDTQEWVLSRVHEVTAYDPAQ